MRSTQSVLPDVDPRLKQHGFTSVMDLKPGAGMGGPEKRYSLPASLH